MVIWIKAACENNREGFRATLAAALSAWTDLRALFSPSKIDEITPHESAVIQGLAEFRAGKARSLPADF